MRILGTLLVVAAVAASSAAASPQKGYFTFRTPDRKIECGAFIAGKYSESLLRCDIRTGLKPKVTLELRPKGRALIGCVSDAIAPIKQVLRYGQTFRKGPFTCKLARTGLTCKNKSKHGFFLSKKLWRRL